MDPAILPKFIMLSIPNLENSPHLNRCFTLYKPCQKCEEPLIFELKKPPSCRYLAYTIVNHSSLGSWMVFQIHFTSRHSFIILVLIIQDLLGLHYWIQVLCRVAEALGKAQIALGEAFAECGTRQRTHDKKLIGKALFIECLLSGTRQRLCWEPRGHSAKKSDRHGAGPVDGRFVECQPCHHDK